MREKFKFRIEVVALVVLGAIVLVVSLHGRHRPPEDRDVLPSVPIGPPTPASR